jgi:hypothetical protein
VQHGGYTEIPDGWIREFKNQIARDRIAQRAWKQIEATGLEEGSLLMLWGFAGGAAPELDAMHRKAEDASDRLRAAHREAEIAEAKRPKRAHDANLFRNRATAAQETAMSSTWAMPTAETATLGDELNKVPAVTAGQPTFPAIRKALTKSAGKRSPVNRFYFLFVLQAYAAEHGVRLGIKRLVALARYAEPSPDSTVDAGTVGRYLRSMPPSLKESILRDVLPTLPPRSLTEH